MNAVSYILLGLVAGILSGLIGLAEERLLFPSSFYSSACHNTWPRGRHWRSWFHQSAYLQHGNITRECYVDFHGAGLICLGFLIGGLAQHWKKSSARPSF